MNVSPTASLKGNLRNGRANGQVYKREDPEEAERFLNGHGHPNGGLDMMVLEPLALEDPPTLVPDRKRKWSTSWQFFASCVSMSVGIGNLWRFPSTAASKGGGAFLIPYITVLCLIGYPIYLLELVVGQFMAEGPVKIWAMAPIFKGVGYGSAFVFFVIISFYCFIMAISLRYLIASFSCTLPWTIAGNVSDFNSTSTEALYFKQVLNQTDNILNGVGNPDWALSLLLLAFWIIMFGAMVKGIKSSGVVAYFTAGFPYIVLLILLIQGAMLPGAGQGILYLITPQWEQLLNADVWFSAIGQCFFSLTVALGPVILYGGYNKFRYNVYRDAILLSGMDLFTSLLAGFVTFSALGFLAHHKGVEVKEVSRGGFALVFQSYPLIISKLPWGQNLFAVLFFLMFTTLGLGSSMSILSVVEILQKKFRQVPKWVITALFCLISFFAGLIYVTPGGIYVLEVISDHCDLLLNLFGLLEVVGICWIYGLRNLIRDVEFMLQRKISVFWKICWGFVVPVGLSIILIRTLATWKGYDSNVFSYGVVAFGWIFTAVVVLIFVGSAVHAIHSQDEVGIRNKFLAALRPSSSWGPPSEFRQDYRALAQPQSYIGAFREKIQSWTSG